MKKIIDSLNHPMRQAIWLFVAGLAVQMLVLLLYMSEKSPHFYHYVVSATILLLYAFFNSVYLLKTEQMTDYIRSSIYGFIILLISGFGLASAFSNLPDSDRMSVRWIFFMIIFSYFIFLTIAYFMRRIIEYAQNQDTESNN